MKIVSVVLVPVLFAVMSCQPASPPPAKGKVTVGDTAKFYPLTVFFTKQVEYVDLRNFLLYRVTVKDGRKDSSAINKDQFKILSRVFFDRSLSAPAVKALYKESVFQDLSTKSYTLNYSPVNGNPEVRNIDILLDEQTNFVKRVFIRSSYAHGDTLIDEQCNWKTDKSFQVNRFLQTKKGYRSTELNFINWNDR